MQSRAIYGASYHTDIFVRDKTSLKSMIQGRRDSNSYIKGNIKWHTLYSYSVFAVEVLYIFLL